MFRRAIQSTIKLRSSSREGVMPEAYIYDHVRTPRGRGKADGALHEVTALALATVPLRALKERNNLVQDVVDDVVLGVVDPVGEAGPDSAGCAALKPGTAWRANQPVLCLQSRCGEF